MTTVRPPLPKTTRPPPKISVRPAKPPTGASRDTLKALARMHAAAKELHLLLPHVTAIRTVFHEDGKITSMYEKSPRPSPKS